MKYRTELANIKLKNGNEISGFRLVHVDTKKNLEYADKRRQIGEEATAQLGTQCWG